MHTSKIEWVLNPDNKTLGKIWNPITGCLNHTDGMCKGGGFPCYAYRLAHGRLKERYLANKNIAPTSLPYNISTMLADNDPFYPRFWEDRLEELITRNEYLDGNVPIPTKPRGIFVCDMADLFGIGVPEEWTKRVLDAIDFNKYHDRFYLLTKQPQNLIKFSPFPDNCWVGVTACNEAMWAEALWQLSKIQASIKYISIEPFLKRIPQYAGGIKNCGIDWLIIGSQTKPNVYPRIEWVKEIVEAANKTGIPVFLKDNLWPLFDGSHYAVPMWAFGKDSRLRQEMPK